MIASHIGPELARAADILIADYCAVKPGEAVLITADTASDMSVIEAVMNAADSLESKPVVNVIPPLPFQGFLQLFEEGIDFANLWKFSAIAQ